MPRFLYFFFVIIFIVFSCSESEKSFTIYTIGDSTMANKPEEVFPETGWAQVLQQYFDSTVSIKNVALNGRSTKSFIDEGHWKEVFDNLQFGDYVFIQFGHNDEKDYDTTRYTVPFGSYSENLEKFVLESHQKGAIPVLFTSIVRRKFGEDGKLIPTHGEYPEACRQVAEKLNIPLIDLQKLTENWVNSLGDETSKDMYLWTLPNEKYPEGRQDDTHLSKIGAENVARLALEESKKLELGFAEYITMIQ